MLRLSTNVLLVWGLFAFLLLAICASVPCQAVEYGIEVQEDKVSVLIDGKLFTEYHTLSGTKPILWPIYGPSGTKMTRGYPMQPATKTEKSDHPHHRSLWFTHGIVNGVDFWLEDTKEPHARIKHTGFTKTEATQEGVRIDTTNDWLDAKGKRILKDEQSLLFGEVDGSRFIDVTTKFIASDGDVTFGDTKEGSFGVRVAGTMKVDSKLGGSIINSEGDRDANSWGMPAAWVDYHGPIDGKPVGIAILSHPSNPRHPCRWHVRTYGLFAANPFGEKDFKKVDGFKQGPFKIPNGESATFRYRVVLHDGDEKDAKIVSLFQDFASE